MHLSSAYVENVSFSDLNSAMARMLVVRVSLLLGSRHGNREAYNRSEFGNPFCWVRRLSSRSHRDNLYINGINLYNSAT